MVTEVLLPSQTEHAPRGSRVAAVLAPCLVVLATVLLVALGLALSRLHGRRRRRAGGGLTPRRPEEGGASSSAAPGDVALRTLAARVERLV